MASTPVLGLALGGGAVRGAAHLGVLEVLQREGIKPDVITGTSAGAVFGALAAAHADLSEVAELVRQVRWPKLIRPTLGRAALFDTDPLGRLLTRLIGSTTFAELPTKLAVIACDLGSGEAAALSSGEVARAVRASTAVPGLFRPVEIDGRWYVDGGLASILPVDAARRLGAEIVVAVDVLSYTGETAPPGTLVEVLLAAARILATNQTAERGRADVVIQPELATSSTWDLSRAAEFRALGQAACERRLPAIVAALANVVIPAADGQQQPAPNRRPRQDGPFGPGHEAPRGARWTDGRTT